MRDAGTASDGTGRHRDPVRGSDTVGPSARVVAGRARGTLYCLSSPDPALMSAPISGYVVG